MAVALFSHSHGHFPTFGHLETLIFEGPLHSIPAVCGQ
jgi:hypothetical protein